MATPSFNAGDTIRIHAEVRDANTKLYDPRSVRVTVIADWGVSEDNAKREGLGKYYTDVFLPTAGTLTVRFISNDPGDSNTGSETYQVRAASSFQDLLLSRPLEIKPEPRVSSAGARWQQPLPNALPKKTK